MSSDAVQQALRKALDEKANKLVRDVIGVAHRYENAGGTPPHTLNYREPRVRIRDFCDVVKALLTTHQKETGEIDTAIQRDRDADR